MSRFAAVAFLALALLFSFAQFASAQTAQTSSDATCPAPNPPKAGATVASEYAGLAKPASFTVPDPGDSSKTIKVTNLSQQKCTQSCQSGGTVSGMCVSQDKCEAETTCSGQKPQQVTLQQIQNAVNGTGASSQSSQTPNQTVSQEFQNLQSDSQTPSQTVSQEFQTLQSPNSDGSGLTTQQLQTYGQNLLQNGSTPQSPVVPYQSLFTQAYNALTGSSDTDEPNPIAVPTTPEQYLQSTFDTNPSGTLSGTNAGQEAVQSSVYSGTTDVQNCGVTCTITNWGSSAYDWWNSLTPTQQAVTVAGASVGLATGGAGIALTAIAEPVVLAGSAMISSGAFGTIGSGLYAYYSQPTPPPEQITEVDLSPPEAVAPQEISEPLPQPALTSSDLSPSDIASINQNSTAAGLPPLANPSPEPLPAAPTTPVESSPLPPLESPAEVAQATPAQPQEYPTSQSETPVNAPPAQPATPPAAQPASTPTGQSAQQPSGGQPNAGGGQQVVQNGGATGGSPNNIGGPAGQSAGNSALSFLSGLLSGLRPSASSASAPASQPIVYSATAPIVQLPATEEGLLGPCSGSSCGATSNLPEPQIVAVLPAATQTAQGTGGNSSTPSSNGNIPQTIIPGTAQTQNGSGNAGGSSQSSFTSATGQNGNNTVINPSGTQQGPTGTPNPSGTQQGGTGAPASAPGNNPAQTTPQQNQTPPAQTQPQQLAGKQPTGQGNGTGSGVGSGSQTGVQGSGAKLATIPAILPSIISKVLSLLGPSKVNAEPGPQFSPQNAAQVFAKGFRTFVATAVNRTQDTTRQTVTDIANGIGAAAYLSRAVDGDLKGRLQNYVKEAQVLKQTFNSCVPANQDPDQGLSFGQKLCLGGARIAGTETSLQDAAQNFATKGEGLVSDVVKYVNTNHTPAPPSQTPPPAQQNSPATTPNCPPGQTACIGNIGTAAPPVTSVNRESTGNNQTPPPAAAQPQTNQQPPASPPLAAKTAPITGAASVYDCRLGGINGNCRTSATGWAVNPSEYSAALQLNYAQAFHTGYGHGAVGYALVQDLDNGRQMVVKVNDNGPLTPGRIIDLSPASMNCLGYGICNNDSTLRSTVLPHVQVTVLQGNYTAGPLAGGATPAALPCNYRGCAPPTPTAQVAQARVPDLTSVQNCTKASGICVTDPTTGASYTCQGDSATCVPASQQQLALSRLCASNPATCNTNVASYTETPSGTTQQQAQPRKIIAIQSNYGTIGKLARNPNVPTVSGISSQDMISRLRAAGVSVTDDSSASLQNYPHGKNQMTALTWHGDGSSGNGAGLVQEEISNNQSGKSAAQAVLQQDGTLVIVAPLDAVSFHAATMNQLGPGIEIQGINNSATANPTPAQIAAMQKITDVAMNQLGWEVGTHGQIEPGHKDAWEAGPATVNYVYSGVSTAQVPTYTLADSSGNPVLDPDGKPVITTQAPGSNSTGQFLTNPDGSLYIDPSTNAPVPVTPVQVTQDQTNPNLYTASDDRPVQPAPANPWPGHIASPYPIAAASQPAALPRYAQPPYQVASAQPQPVPQPLPQPIPSLTPQASTTPATPVVTLVANPPSVASGGTSRLSWSSVGTAACQVGPQNGALIGTSTTGSAFSAVLSTTTLFIASCATITNTTISATTSVRVQ